jgi:imidazolonepropionase-like amidohydrolase
VIASIVLVALPFLDGGTGPTGLSRSPAEAGDVGGSGLAFLAEKILVCPWEGEQVVDHGVLLVKDGKIEAVGKQGELAIPAGYEELDVGARWLTPGFIDLHSHAAGAPLFPPQAVNDLNDLIYLANPGLRASSAVEPQVATVRAGIAGGVTTLLYIPGSGSNIGGQGVLVKTAFDRYEENLVRDPGSMKLAQWGNPEAWGIGVGMSFENWNTRHTIQRGLAYAKRWEAFEKGEGPEPERDIELDVFRDLQKREIAISVHTQVYQVVLMTLTMLAGEFHLPVFTDHSEIGGWLTGALAQELGVPAIVGPRSVDHVYNRGFIEWARNKHEGVRGLAAGYQSLGHTQVGFNTDSPFVPLEELLVQATMGVRYGMDDSGLAALRGLTIVPARAALIDERVGSLEPGKDADVLVCDGYPVDPRTAIDLVFVNGRRAYDAERDGRRW